MSRLTNWGENKFADYYLRNRPWAFPTAWYIGLASAASDSSITELSGTGYARVPIQRGFSSFSATQSVGAMLTSTGTTHRTANIAGFTFGISGSAWGTALFVVLYDAPVGGNAFIYADIDGGALVIGNAQEVAFDAGALLITVGLTGGMSDYLSNKIIDEVFRNGPAFNKPTNLYARLLTSAPSNAGGGTEVVAPSYGRMAIPRSLDAWSGTQAPATTIDSFGTGGLISNNLGIIFPTPTTPWGTVSHFALNDAAVAGNLWLWGTMTVPRSVLSTSPPPTLLPGSLTITFN